MITEICIPLCCKRRSLRDRYICAHVYVSSDALNDVKEMFVKTVLRDQDCFRQERGWETLLALIPDKGMSEVSVTGSRSDLLPSDVADSLRSRWQNSESSSSTKWTDLLKAREKLADQHLRYVSCLRPT